MTESVSWKYPRSLVSQVSWEHLERQRQCLKSLARLGYILVVTATPKTDRKLKTSFKIHTLQGSSRRQCTWERINNQTWILFLMQWLHVWRRRQQSAKTFGQMSVKLTKAIKRMYSTGHTHTNVHIYCICTHAYTYIYSCTSRQTHACERAPSGQPPNHPQHFMGWLTYFAMNHVYSSSGIPESLSLSTACEVCVSSHLIKT